MRAQFLYILAIFLLTGLSVAGGQAPASYQWKYHTTAQRLLQIEESYSKLTDANKRAYYDPMYQTIDRLIDAAKIRLAPYTKPGQTIDSAKAKLVLQTIDSVLTEQHFIVCIIVDRLSEALTPKKLEQFTCYKYLPGYRREFCERQPDSLYYGVDCDLGAMLYVSIGEVLNFPLKLIEIPAHNFVRWRFADNSYLNFDNNTGLIYSDDSFRNGQTATSSSRFSLAEEKACHFLQDMGEKEVRAYYLTIIGIFISHQGRYAETEQVYKEAIAARPYDVLAMNNLSWMYLTLPDFKKTVYYKEAYRLSKLVDQLLPSSIEYKDTYSCACAGIGDFKKAVTVEKNARDKPKRLVGYNKRMTCLDIGETLW
jgi:hypothetical protein